ncbi:MAG: N,N'-diacetylchitobiose phosphorylase [Oscillospiraceae bacterium]|nr:N,N'-diacetylchitobiose phosphorylase [Oscillospiraceae bacterium]
MSKANYGYFDENNKEYVITRPDTPSAWANYLGSPEYGAIISNNAGGYSFVKSGANGRVIRYRFNSVTNDQPGRYVYLKDKETGDFWGSSWMPVGKCLDDYKTECRHGTAYTTITSEYKGIKTDSLYYVPQDATYEVWRVKVTNSGAKERKLSVTGYVEFTNDPNYEQDQVNLQYSLFISRTYFKDTFIKQVYNPNFNDPNKERFFGLAGQKIDKFCGDRDKFVGSWRGYQNPKGIENGLNGDLNYCGNSCGALQSDIVLQPGETKTFVYIVGEKPEADAAKIIAGYADVSVCEKELEVLKSFWHGKLGNLQVKTPDENFNAMLNTWNAYQCFITFIWSRAASFQYCGLRNGFGYRDTVQDIQGIIHLDPEMAAEQIRFMLTAQVTEGAGLPLVKYTHNPPNEDKPGMASYDTETKHDSYRADDALWLFPTIYKYITETGNTAFLDEDIFFADGGESGSVYEHLKRAIDFSMNNLGGHGMPAGLHADWNDCLRLGKKGESTFVAFQLYYAVNNMKRYAQARNDSEYLAYLNDLSDKLAKTFNKDCWNGDRWIRGFTQEGKVIGQKGDNEASMWLNPQSWGVISGLSTDEQATASMDSVNRELNTPYGVMVMYPAYVKDGIHGTTLMHCFPACVKENAGIFSQPQGWVILAESMLGRGDKAYQYWKEAAPSTHDSDLRILEPYVHGQFVEGKDSPFAGRAHVHWLTGTASTVMVGSVEGILGLRPELNGLVINPSIPADWKAFEMKKNFRGKVLNIKVNNPNGAQNGNNATVTVNGAKIDGLLIETSALKDTNDIVVDM